MTQSCILHSAISQYKSKTRKKGWPDNQNLPTTLYSKEKGLRFAGVVSEREAQCSRRSKRNWTKTTHNTNLGLLPIYVNTVIRVYVLKHLSKNSYVLQLLFYSEFNYMYS